MYMNYRPGAGSGSPASSSSSGGVGTTPVSARLDETAALGILQHLNRQELQELLDNDNKLSELIGDLQQVKGIEVDKETCLASNKSLAEYTLSREARFQQAKEQLAATYEQAIKIQKQFDERKQKMQYTKDRQSLDTTLALLQTEAAKAEEESETIANAFLDGSMEIEDFLASYISKRKLAHLRKVKSEKMLEIIQKRQRVPQRPPPPPPAGSGTSWPAAQVNNHWGASSVPYPTTNYGMPDPNTYLPR